MALQVGKVEEEFRTCMAVDAPAVDEYEIQSLEDESGIFGLYGVNGDRRGRSNHVEVVVNGESINMEIDTEADYSIMISDTYLLTDVQLKTYSGETSRTRSQMLCKVLYSGQEYVLPMIVAENENKPTLLGRNWLEKLRLIGTRFLV